jgi:uncharacterized protein YegL
VSGGLAFDPAVVARRQLHVLFALDCSGSMTGDRIASLNYAMRTALPELRDVAAENPEVDVRVRVLGFGAETAWQTAEAVPAGMVGWTDLAAGGETPMGEALAMLGGALGAEAMPGRQLPPVVVLASDGLPTDDFEAGLAAFFAAEYAEAAMRLAIAIGTDADHWALERFIRNPAIKPLRANNATELVHRIKWATTAPVKAASSPTNAPDAFAAIADSGPASPPSDIIW